MIDRQTKERILDAANIVDVVSEFVTLKKAGANYKGLCPFHNERTPSFSVSPARNYCHCFSCGKGGGPVTFIMEHEQMTYPEALRWLAKKYNIEIHERELSDDEKREQSERESIYIVNEWVANYYSDILQNDVDGRAIGMQYFRSRGFRDDIIKKFRLGFALPDRYVLAKEARKQGYKAEFLVKSGTCYVKDNAGNQASGDGDVLIDRYAGRAIFPWVAMNGKVVAFGGRKLDKETKGVAQKYVNSPETPIFQKDHHLYGIFQAKKAIAKEDCVFMVEGYTDVIAMHQCGIENVVANSGTALSFHQIHMLHRLTSNIVLLYDGDEAGKKAALRGMDMLLSEKMNVKVLFLPDGDDPDSFARKHSAEEYRQYIADNQKDIIQFKIDALLTGVTDPTKKAAAISSIVKSVSVIPDNVLRATYIHECAVSLKMSESVLIQQMNKFIAEAQQQKNRVGAPEQQPEQQAPAEPAVAPAPSMAVDTSLWDIEKMLIQTIVRYGERFVYEAEDEETQEIVQLNLVEYIYYNLSGDSLVLTNPLYQRILDESYTHCRDEAFNAAPFLSQSPDYEISRACTEMLIDPYNLNEKTVEGLQLNNQQILDRAEHILLDYRKAIIDRKMTNILAQLQQCRDDAEKTIALMKEYQATQQIRNQLAKKLGNSIAIGR